ncbi:hypothetical protein [Actinacidiphila oryziradicis]|nr:hypothetical protein [Actinacidiphila oryziradicis]
MRPVPVRQWSLPLLRIRVDPRGGEVVVDSSRHAERLMPRAV